MEQNSIPGAGAAKGAFLRHELNLFLIALTFLTRIPSPVAIDFTTTALNQSARYFPLVGVLVGAAGAVTLALAAVCLPVPVAVLLAMMATLLITGAFHEDGLADTFDGMGGGQTRDQVLAIMKDSRLGTYGTIALCMALALKAALLMALPVSEAVIALLSGLGISRWLAISYLLDLRFVLEWHLSKVKPLAQQLDSREFAFASVTGLGLCLMMIATAGIMATLVALLLLGGFRWWFGRYLVRRLGGFTGDCLGASQQISEVLIYLAWVAMTWNLR